MPSFDFSQVTATYDKASYSPGDQIKLSLSGNVIRSGDPTVELVSATIQLTTASGGTGSVTAEVPVSKPGAVTNEAPLFDGGATFTAAGRTWVVAADRKSATTTA